MKGWKTWLAVGCTAVLGTLNIVNGDTAGGLQQPTLALGMFGLGHKIEKAKN
jgi:hypothetical protein